MEFIIISILLFLLVLVPFVLLGGLDHWLKVSKVRKKWEK